MNPWLQLPESRPAVPDHAQYVPQVRRDGRRIRRVTPIGEYCDPGVCPHPVSARVWPNEPNAISRCHDCGATKNRHGWYIA